MKQLWIAVGVAFGGLFVGLTVDQAPAFFALDAASRASWVQAIGTIVAIAASSGIAVWIDQGTARRIAEERRQRAQALRSEAAAALIMGAASMSAVKRYLLEDHVYWERLQELLGTGRAANMALEVILRREIPADLIIQLTRGRDVLELCLSKFSYDDSVMQRSLAGTLFFVNKAGLVHAADEAENALMAMGQAIHH